MKNNIDIHAAEDKMINEMLNNDVNRRNHGKFYTPTLFVDYAHKMISEQLGENWKDEYVVWDNCCGTKNLTRDYRFKELYCSTLENAELELSKKYNPEAVSFQFDFLNDYIPMPDDLDIHETKIPQGLLEAFKQNKKIVFFLNPPYGKATGAGGGGNIEVGTSNTITKTNMQKEKIEGSEFIKQFLWRITDIKRKFNLTDCVVAVYTSPSWLIKPQSEKFRKLFLNHFLYKDGIMFQASEFANVSTQWGITFNIWNSVISNENIEKNNFVHKLVKSNSNGDIEIIGAKTLYNFDGLNVKTCSQYVSEKLVGKKQEQEIIYTNKIREMYFKKEKEKVYSDYLCAIYCAGNDVQHEQSILNVLPRGGGNLNLTKNNFNEACVTLALRRLISDNWFIHNDMYNMSVDIPKSFVNDSIMYSCFANYCCSINLDGDRLKNEFFWMSKEELQELANEYHNDDCYTDAHTADERFVYNYIKEHRSEFSEEALEVLNAAEELVRKTFKYRELFNDEHPEYQINNWDCGWYQIKALAKQYAPDDLKAFKELYKKLSDKMRPMVYELGFLRA